MEYVFGKIEEMCPSCDYVNELEWNGKDRIIKCQQCGRPLVLCCLCDWDNCICSDCEYEKNVYMLLVKDMYRGYLKNISRRVI